MVRFYGYSRIKPAPLIELQPFIELVEIT